jgi:ankyrin repeat protein
MSPPVASQQSLGPHVLGHALLIAARSSKADQVEALLSQGAPVDVRSDQQWTPAMWAANFGDEVSLRLLIQAGADVNAHDSDRMTPAMIAACNGHHGSLLALRHAGADLQAVDHEGLSAAMYAAYNDELSCLLFLVEQGASLTATCHKGRTVGAISQLRGHTATASWLDALASSQNDQSLLRSMLPEPAPSTSKKTTLPGRPRM